MKLLLHRPLVTNKVTQRFYDNKACITNRGKIVSKVGNVCPVGSTPFYPSIGMKAHGGMDFKAWHGEQIFHCGNYDGWMKIEKDMQGGIGVDVVSNEPVELKDGRKVYIKTRYWHLKAPVGHDKKQVKLGDIIGLADNTGSSSGDHLHFGLKVCDKNGNPLEKTNGYNGGMDPEPYMALNVDAQTASKYLNIKPLPLTAQEQKEINSQLSSARQLLLALKALIQRI
jgi:hypothetical protein